MYEIPKISVPVVVHLVNDESIPGSIWITENLISAGGDPLVEEFLNQETDNFFSFESDAGAFRVINKGQITYIETNQDDSEASAQTPHTPVSLVAHFVNGQALYGVVLPTMVEETRVSDLLNQTRDFLVLYRQNQKIVFNRNLIVYANAH